MASPSFIPIILLSSTLTISSLELSIVYAKLGLPICSVCTFTSLFSPTVKYMLPFEILKDKTSWILGLIVTSLVIHLDLIVTLPSSFKTSKVQLLFSIKA